MLNAKRKWQWGRAWVAAGLVGAVMCLPVFSSAQTGGSGDQAQTAPAATPGPEPSQIAPPPAAASAPAPNQDAAQTQDAPPAPDSSPPDADQSDSTQPVAKSLDTGLPLRTAMSPLHWGHLSLLSVEGFAAYNNDNVQQISNLGRQFGAVQGLVVYSIRKAKSSLDLQYNPYVWFSQNTTYKDFTANAVDFLTSHTFNRRWSLIVNDNFQYSPNLANTLHSAFAADFSSNSSTQTPFLSVGRKTLLNSANVTVNSQLSAKSRLTFNAVDNFAHLGSYEGSSNTTVPSSDERLNAYGGGVIWSRQWSSRTTLNLSYNYRRQYTAGVTSHTTFNSADVGFSRVLKPSLTLTMQVGPGWSKSDIGSNGTQTQNRTTVQGSAELYKSFHNGGVALSFYRNSEFSGVISNSYNNRYDVELNHRLLTRLNFEINGSYIQQEFVGRHSNDGVLGWTALTCMLSRNWSVFGGYRYLHMHGNPTVLGEQQMVSAGIRWAWQPEAVHK